MASPPFGNAARVASQLNVKLKSGVRSQNHEASNMFPHDRIRDFFSGRIRIRLRGLRVNAVKGSSFREESANAFNPGNFIEQTLRVDLLRIYNIRWNHIASQI